MSMVTLIILATKGWARPFSFTSVLSEARKDLSFVWNHLPVANSKSKSSVFGVNIGSVDLSSDMIDFVDVGKRHPGRCKDPKSPCSCKTAHEQIKGDTKHVTHHTCDTNARSKRTTPGGYQCKQLTEPLYYNNGTVIVRNIGCELRCVDD